MIGDNTVMHVDSNIFSTRIEDEDTEAIAESTVGKLEIDVHGQLSSVNSLLSLPTSICNVSSTSCRKIIHHVDSEKIITFNISNLDSSFPRR